MYIVFILYVIVSILFVPVQKAEFQRLRNADLVRRAIDGPLRAERERDEQRLGSIRRYIAGNEMNIKLFEWSLNQLDNLTPAEAGSLLQDVMEMRANVVKARKYENVLEWGEEQRKLKPDFATERLIRDRIDEAEREMWLTPQAPMPREVKQ